MFRRLRVPTPAIRRTLGHRQTMRNGHRRARGHVDGRVGTASGRAGPGGLSGRAGAWTLASPAHSESAPAACGPGPAGPRTSVADPARGTLGSVTCTEPGPGPRAGLPGPVNRRRRPPTPQTNVRLGVTVTRPAGADSVAVSESESHHVIESSVPLVG